ncbi:MAG TPA: AAA family ATPase, partial [Acidobacteriota bacterium]|nr:AAA family ATPase [Acidobacteriota bacterium]
MHLKTVTLRNFRCFKELKLNLHPRLTVLVAENGGGKSAVLDAIRMGLSLYIDTITDTQQKVKFSHTDIQVFQGNYTEQITFEGDCEIAGQSLHWSQALKSSNKSNRLTTKNTRSLTNAAKALRDQVNNFHVNSGQPVPILSLVVSYGTKRLWIDNLRKEKLRINRSNNIRLEGYVGCLGSSASVSTIVGWYEARMKEMGSGQYSTETENYTKVIAGIETAMKVVLEPTGWCELEWDFSKKKLLVKHSVFGSLLL